MTRGALQNGFDHIEALLYPLILEPFASFCLVARFELFHGRFKPPARLRCPALKTPSSKAPWVVDTKERGRAKTATFGTLNIQSGETSTLLGHGVKSPCKCNICKSSQMMGAPCEAILPSYPQPFPGLVRNGTRESSIKQTRATTWKRKDSRKKQFMQPVITHFLLAMFWGKAPLEIPNNFTRLHRFASDG